MKLNCQRLKRGTFAGIILLLLTLGSGISGVAVVKAQITPANQMQITQLTQLLNLLRAQLALLIAGNTAMVVGSTVETTGQLNVRLAPGTAAGISGIQPAATSGVVTAGPQQSGGYTWWYIDYATGSDGWSAGNWLVAINQATVQSISNNENPTVAGSAKSANVLSFSVAGPGGDKVYGSGVITVRDGQWSHKIATDLPNGTYTLKLYTNTVEIAQRSFTITTSSITLPQVSWIEPSNYSTIDARGSIKTVYLDRTTRFTAKSYDTLLVRWDEEFRLDNSATCTIFAWYDKVYRSVTVTNTTSNYNAVGEYIPVTERYQNSNLEKVEVSCTSLTDNFKALLTVSTESTSDSIEPKMYQTDEETSADNNDSSIVSDNAGDFTLEFDITAVDGSLSIPISSSLTSVTAGIVYSVLDSSNQVVDSSYVETDLITGTLTSTARVSGGYYVFDQDERKSFKLRVVFDPVDSGNYKVRLDKIRYYRNGDTSRLYTKTLSNDDIETRQLSILGTGIAANGPLGGYVGYLNNVLFTSQTIKQTDAYENCVAKATANPTQTVHCTWNGVSIFDNRIITVGQATSTLAIGIGANQGTYPAGTSATTSSSSTGIINVYLADPVGYADDSLVLVLTGQEAIEWRLSGPGLRAVDKIYASGYRQPKVTGRPSGATLITRSFEIGSPTYFTNYQNSGSSYTKLHNFVQKTYLTKFQQYHGAYIQNQVNITAYPTP